MWQSFNGQGARTSYFEQSATKSEVLLSSMRQHNLELFLSVYTEITKAAFFAHRLLLTILIPYSLFPVNFSTEKLHCKKMLYMNN